MSVSENTLAIIKPDYMDKRAEIKQCFIHNGFFITSKKMVSFTPEQAAEFYKDLEKQDASFPIQVKSLSNGLTQALMLSKENAIRDLLILITSPSYRQYFYSEDECKIHASKSTENAEKEIRYIFPNVIFEPSKTIKFGSINGKSQLFGLVAMGTIAALESKTADPKKFLAEWLSEHSYGSLSN